MPLSGIAMHEALLVGVAEALEGIEHDGLRDGDGEPAVACRASQELCLVPFDHVA